MIKKKTIKIRKVSLKSAVKAKKPIKKKSISALVFTKSEENPIISPKSENNWEAWQTFNPGVILIDNKVHFLYRAIGKDGISRLGYAVSSNGFYIDKRLPTRFQAMAFTLINDYRPLLTSTRKAHRLLLFFRIFLEAVLAELKTRALFV